MPWLISIALTRRSRVTTRSLKRKPDHVDAIDSRIWVFKKLERNREELAEYERLRALAPDFPPLASDIVHAHASACHWAELAQLEQALSKKVAACEPVVDPFTFILCSNSPQQQLACARSYLSSKKITAVQRDWKTSGLHIRIRPASRIFHWISAGMLNRLYHGGVVRAS